MSVFMPSILFTVFLVCLTQDIILSNEDDHDPLLNISALTPVKVPEQLLIRMKDIKNLSDFLNLFFVSEEDHSRGSKKPLLGAPGAIAPFAACQPDLQIVSLKSENPAIFLWPPCVRVRRCAGCCTSGRLHCMPTETSIRNFTVLRLRYNPFNPDTFESEGVEVHDVEEHDRCSCSCAQIATDCSTHQQYKEDECRCVCNPLRCTGSNWLWDDTDCTCRCRRVRQCSTGRRFSPLTCRCEELKRNLSRTLNSSYPF